jgi:glucokinase
MVFSKTVNASVMRSINVSTVLDLIRRESPISRSKIAERLDMSLPTVMRIVDELVEENLVIDAGSTEWSGGRQGSLLKLKQSSYVVIGIDLGGQRLYGAVADGEGNILYEVSDRNNCADVDGVFDCQVALIQELIGKSGHDMPVMRGVCVGNVGITYSKEGIVMWAPSLNLRNFPLKARRKEHFALPVIVDNDVNLAALGELWLGPGEQVTNMVLIAISTGIGAGIILDGALYPGTPEAVGEIGYFLPSNQFRGQHCENFGALEALISVSGIAKRGKSVLAELQPHTAGDGLGAEDVFAAYKRGEAWAQKTLQETIDYLAMVITSVSILFDPQLVVLGGSPSRTPSGLMKKPSGFPSTRCLGTTMICRRSLKPSRRFSVTRAKCAKRFRQTASDLTCRTVRCDIA